MMTPSESRNKENTMKRATERAFGWKVRRMKANIKEEWDDTTVNEESVENWVSSSAEIVKRDEKEKK